MYYDFGSVNILQPYSSQRLVPQVLGLRRFDQNPPSPTLLLFHYKKEELIASFKPNSPKFP